MDVKNILISAQNPDDNIRKWAEFYLIELEKKDIQEFFINLSKILSEEHFEPQIRRLAGLILKNKLEMPENGNKNFLSYKWLKFIDKSIRENIKKIILDVFKSSSKIARRTASQILAKITIIELTNQEQNNILDLFDKILENDKKDENFNHAIIETIEFICQETNSEKFPELIFQKFSVQIIKILLQAINETCYISSNIKFSALNGLLSSIEFIEDILKEKRYRNYILKSVCAQIYNFDTLIRALSFETLDKIAQNYYYWLEDYMSFLFEVTINIIQKDNDLVILQVIEFWSTIADQEFEINMELYQFLNEGKFFLCYSSNYILKTSSYLPILLLNCILKKKKSESFEEWNCCSAAAACLNLMCQVSPREIIHPVIFFIDKNISNQNLIVDIECITLTFVAIFDGIGSKLLYGYVKKIIEFWLINFQKSSIEIQNIINLTIGKISHYFSCMVRYYLDQIMQNVLFNLTNKLILQTSYWCLNEILQFFGKEGIADWSFEYIASVIINKILLKSQNYGVTNELFEFFCSLIINSSVRSKTFILALLPFFLTNLSISIIKKEENSELQKNFCKILGYSIQKYGEKINPVFMEKFTKLISLIISEFMNNNLNWSIEEEILTCLGAIIQIQKNKKSLKIKDLVNFLMHCIDNTENSQNCSLAVGIIGDICRTIEKEIKPFGHKIIEILICNIKKNNIDKKLTPLFITCIGDIMLVFGFSLRYFNILIDLFKKIINNYKEFFFNKNFENFEINFKIEEAILEGITGIIQGFQDQKDNYMLDKLYDKFKWIIDFVYELISKDRMFKIIKICIGLVGDLSLNFEFVKKVFQNEIWVFQLLYESKNNKELKIRNIGNWAFDSIFY